MGRRVTLDDLREVHPIIFRSLQKLLDEPNADQLGLVFQVWNCICCAAVVRCLSDMTPRLPCGCSLLWNSRVNSWQI